MYKIRFADNSEYTGGEPQDSRWNDMPDKAIESIQYSFLGIGFIFKGFESYNHILERVVVLSNNPAQAVKPPQRITKIILMARWKSRVYEVIYDLERKRVYQQVEVFGKKYIDKEISVLGRNMRIGQATTGWKKGVFDPKAHPKIKRY